MRNWEISKNIRKFGNLENFWTFWKFQKYLENLGHIGKCRQFRKVLKISKHSNNFEEKKLLEDVITMGVSQSWVSPFTRVILHGCMNVCCITYYYMWNVYSSSPLVNSQSHDHQAYFLPKTILTRQYYSKLLSHDWIWPIGLEKAQKVY